MKRAIVLSAGLGTRLRPLTDWVPKPLVWLGDRPQIDHVLGRLAKAGFERAVVNTHHLHEQFDDDWISRQPLAIERTFEPTILGTAGGITNARALLGGGDVLVYNGDILADVDFDALRARHVSSTSGATLVVVERDESGLGTVGLDADGSVVRLRGEVFGTEVRGADYIGVLALGEDLRARLPEVGCLVGDGLLPWLRSGRKVAAVVHRSGFHDTGTLEAYLDANLDWLGDRTAFVSARARIDAGVALDRSIVLDGATVTGSGVLSRCVVWPGAQTTAPLERTIVTPRGTVFVPAMPIL